MNRLGAAIVLAFSLAAQRCVGRLECHLPAARLGHGANRAATPEIVSQHGVASFALAAVIDPSNNFPTFEYMGSYDVAPTIRVNPGDSIVVDLTDELPPRLGMAGDVNLHFHGLGASPNRPSDDVLTMLAKPGQALRYVVKVPPDQPPGLYWYHTHVHGETNYQVGQGGMSGAIVVNGIERHFPALAKMPEQILIVRDLGTGAGDVAAPAVATPKPVNTNPCVPVPAEVLSVNRQYEPTIRIDPGQREFFRVLNATGHRHLDLALDGIEMQIVAIDGYPVDLSPGHPSSLARTHFIVPVAGRVEFVATGTASSELRTRCYDSGPAGDPDPEATLAYLRPSQHAVRAASLARASQPLQADDRGRTQAATKLPLPVASRVVRFTEDGAKAFFINGKAYAPSAPPMFVVHTGTVERWTIENFTGEVHDFHLHQVHFLVESIDGAPIDHPVWKDTTVVPHGKIAGGTFEPGTAVVIADFRSRLIKGTFLFHCHILDHEDKGMMAKIEAL